jgi:hypothetical protein
MKTKSIFAYDGERSGLALWRAANELAASTTDVVDLVSEFAKNLDAASKSASNSRRNRLDFTRNKKATTGPQTMIWSFFLIVFLIGIGIAVVMALYFGSDYDFRETDATLLNYRLSSCLSENDFDFTIPLEDFKQQIYKTCGLNQQTVEEEFYVFMQKGENNYKIGSGDHTQCALADKNPDFIKCVSNQIVKSDGILLIETGSNQKAQRVIT